MATKITDRDRGFRKFFKNLRKNAGPFRVSVGVHEDSFRTDGVANVDLALAHEFGTPTIPARPFVRTTFDIEKRNFKRKAKRIGENVVQQRGKSKAQLQKYGRAAVKAMRSNLLAGVPPPLLKKTVDAKARAGYSLPDTPLYATGQLFRAIRSKVVKV